jgi:N4-(beta-N-acetylglucosaminyl)-L-asparaginase
MHFPGRVADTGIIGAGTYANRVAAATATGVGEVAIRHALSKKVCDLVESGFSPNQACESALLEVSSIEKLEHLLAVMCIDKRGEVGGATTKSGFQYQFVTSERAEHVIVRPNPVERIST